jgi:hypothetical protein
MPMASVKGVRPNAVRFSALLVTVALLPSLAVTGAAFDSEKPASSPPLQGWLTFAGAVSAALIAGLFAIYQLRRSTAAQRALEREKLVTARTEAELAQVRSSTREYRHAQALPFLERLDRTINESYKAAYMPPYFPDLGGYVPQLRRYADRAMGDWLVATEAMSRHRMRLLLVLNQGRLEIVTSLLTQLMDLMKRILEVRNQVWFHKASAQDLWDVQRSYVRVGYRLMMEIWDAVSNAPKDQALISDLAKESLADALTMPFERASAVSIPYGSTPDFCWIGIWEIDTRPEWQGFVETLTHATYDDFEEKLRGLAGTLHNQAGVLNVTLTKVKAAELEVPCLVVTLPSAKRLEQFLDSELETHRQANGVLWSSYRSPIEIVVGADEQKTRRDPSGPNEPM